MAKLTQAQIREKAEEYAKYAKQIGKLNTAFAKETAELTDRYAREMNKLLDLQARELSPFDEKYKKKIDPLNDKAEALYQEIIGWLKTQPKPVTIETENAIAKFVKGTRPGNRVVDAKAFVEICTKRGIDGFWKAVNVVLKVAEPMLGKNDLDEISKPKEMPYEEATLELK